MAKDLTGTTLGKYQVMERLGRGGMADVYRAYQPGMDRHVAIKIMHPHLADDASFIQRFQREAQAVGALRHPNIVQVIDFDVQDDEHYMVMEYIEGKTLKARLRDHLPLSLLDTLLITQKMADALSYAHEAGMIHRDIKPANIMFSHGDNPVLTDFGIARIVDASGLTASGAFVGTPAYVSPEAVRGEQVDGRTDIYGLGIVLYEMVTGVVPYDADTPFATILKHVNEPLPMPRTHIPDLPDEVEMLILTALAKDPEDRFQTAGEFRDAAANAIDSLSPDMLAQAASVPSQSKTGTGSSPAIHKLTVTTANGKKISTVSGSTHIKKQPAQASATLSVQSASRGKTTFLIGGLAVVLVIVFGGVTLTLSNRTPAATPTSNATPSLVANNYAPLIENVNRFLFHSDFANAQNQVEAALTADPQNYDLLVLHSRILIEQSGTSTDKGLAEAQAAVKSDPQRPQAYIALGQYALFAKTTDNNTAITNLRNAIASFSQAINKGSTDYSAYWLRARANASLNDFLGADNNVPEDAIVKDLDRAASFSPADPRFYVFRGQYYLTKQNYAQAQQNYERAMSLYHDPELYGPLAVTYLSQNQKDKAYELYSTAINKENAHEPRYLADGAYVAWVDSKPDIALQWAKLALDFEPNTPAASYVVALLDWDNKNYDEALKLLNGITKTVQQVTALDSSPFLNKTFDRGLNADRARLLAVSGKIDEAIQAYTDAIKSDDNWVRPLIEQAQLYLQQKNTEAARKDLVKAHDITLADKDANAHSEVLKLLQQIDPGIAMPDMAGMPDTSATAAPTSAATMQTMSGM